MYLHDDSLLNKLQHGFWKNRSCMTAILKISKDIRMKSDNRQVTFLIPLDYGKAFDNVHHIILCIRL